MASQDQHPVILFDGVCNLCNASINFLIDRDPKGKFRFAALQSDYGQKKMEAFGRDPKAFESVLLITEGKLYQKSRAALEIARRMRGLWPLFYGFIIIPGPLRDVVYNWIARNRYRWFGREEACRIPTPELRERFVGGL